MILDYFTTIHYDLNPMDNEMIAKFMQTCFDDGVLYAEGSPEVDLDSEDPIMGTLTIDHRTSTMVYNPVAITPEQLLGLAAHLAKMVAGLDDEATNLALLPTRGSA